jgi:hypothetical protein
VVELQQLPQQEQMVLEVAVAVAHKIMVVATVAILEPMVVVVL